MYSQINFDNGNKFKFNDFLSVDFNFKEIDLENIKYIICNITLVYF